MADEPLSLFVSARLYRRAILSLPRGVTTYRSGRRTRARPRSSRTDAEEHGGWS